MHIANAQDGGASALQLSGALAVGGRIGKAFVVGDVIEVEAANVGFESVVV